jgi:hypothetical protein
MNHNAHESYDSEMTENRPRSALVMCLANPTGNPRPNRMIHLLAEAGIEVDVLSFPLSGALPVVNTYTLPNVQRRSTFLRARNIVHQIAARSFNLLGAHDIAEKLSDLSLGIHKIAPPVNNNKYDLLVVEDLQLLPLSFKMKGNSASARVVFDAREYYPRQYEQRFLFRLLEKPVRQQMCRAYLKRCDHLLTVSPGLAQAYTDEFGTTPHLLRSAPGYRDMPIRQTSNPTIRLVHHGPASPNRGIANMIDVVKQLDSRFTLDLYLVGNEPHIRKLRHHAADCSRVQFRAPVAFEDIIPTLNHYDVGFFYVEPTTFNLLNCLPNKFFEYVQARLAIAIGPSPDMAALVRQYGLGVVAPEFSVPAMVDTLKSFTADEINKAKIASDVAARELCYERESARLLSDISKLFAIG